MTTATAFKLETKTLTYNFEDVTVSTVFIEHVGFETMIFWNGCEVYCKRTQSERSANVYHKGAVMVAERSNLVIQLGKEPQLIAR